MCYLVKCERYQKRHASTEMLIMIVVDVVIKRSKFPERIF